MLQNYSKMSLKFSQFREKEDNELNKVLSWVHYPKETGAFSTKIVAVCTTVVTLMTTTIIGSEPEQIEELCTLH